MTSDFDIVEYDSAKIYTDVLSQLISHCNETLYPGDERRIFGEALVAVFTSLYNLFNDRAKQRTLFFARGLMLDALGDRLRVYRLEASKASATFRFSVATAQAQNIIIPKGTRITPDGNVYFATDESSVLEAGQMYIDLQASCTEGGEKYNGYTAESISILVDLIPYISSVKNITATSGGDDGEPFTYEGDNRFRQRIRNAPAGLSPGTAAGYKYYALTADSDISAVEIDCPEDSPNVVNIYALLNGGKLPDEETLQKILDTIEDANVRIMTDHVQALAPATVDYTIQLKYYCTAENEAATIDAIEGTGGAVEQYIAWQSGAMGRDVNPDKLRTFLFAPASGVGAIRADIISPTFEQLSKVQVAQLSGTPVITHEVVEE